MKALKLALTAACALALASTAQADELRDAVNEDMPGLIELYKDLHANPELSFQEFETAKKLAARMRTLGFDVTEGGWQDWRRRRDEERRRPNRYVARRYGWASCD